MFSKRIHCTVYLEGVNVNFNSIQISEQIGSPPRATISFPAESAALTLLPKTVVHVFYTDSSGEEVLIFMGELTGTGISFSGDKRSIQLTFSGISQNWQTNVVIPMDVKVRTMLSKALYAQITTNFNTETNTGTTNVEAAAASESSNLNPTVYSPAPKKSWEDVKPYIAYAESSNVATAVNINRNKTQDTGLYQINDVHLKGPGDGSKLRAEIDRAFARRGMGVWSSLSAKQEALKDPQFNEEVAQIIYKYQGIDGWSSKNKVLTAIEKNIPANSINRDITRIIMSSDKNNSSTTSSDIIQFADLQGISPLDPIIDKLVNGSETLTNVLQNLATKQFGIQYAGVYWSMVAQAFKFDTMVKVDSNVGIKEIEDLLRTVATVQHIKGLANGTAGGRTIHDILMTILSAVGFDYCEVAAPTYLGGDLRAHILIKPQTHFFPPIMHNVVFDDNIAQLNFSRNFDVEPTRMIAQTPPFQVTGDSLLNAIIGIVIPANIRVTQGLPAEVKSQEDYEKLKMFGLSQEEQCRGVVLAEYQDQTMIENSYLIATANDSGKSSGKTMEELKKGGPEAQSVKRDIGTAFPEVLRKPGEAMQSAQLYHANIASIQYYNKRHAPRSVQVNSPFSPYRMVGFPGVIISKYFPTQTPGIVGNLDSVVSSISADGDSTQTLVFTHCRFVDESPEGQSKLGFLDDNTTVPIPWYESYTKQSNINEFYKQFTGVATSAVVDTKTSQKASVSSMIATLKKDLNRAASKSGTGIEQYILDITKRPLVTRDVIDRLFPSDRKKVRVLTNEPKTSYDATEIFPYVKERRARVEAAFSIVKGKK